MRIYLIGYMGSGKSSMGKKLALRMGYTFVDMDNLIEAQQKQSVSDIFAEQGEAAFRQLERFVLHQTFLQDNIVVSTGGGAPAYFDNLPLMQKNGLTIYLKAEPGVLISRVQANLSSRPLLAGMDAEGLMSFVQKQLSQRAPFYEQAQLHVEAKDLTPAVLHERVKFWMSTR